MAFNMKETSINKMDKKKYDDNYNQIQWNTEDNKIEEEFSKYATIKSNGKNIAVGLSAIPPGHIMLIDETNEKRETVVFWAVFWAIAVVSAAIFISWYAISS